MHTDEIRIGAVSTLVGPFQVGGEEAMRGVELAIAEFGYRVADKSISLYKRSSNAIPDSAVSAVEKLLDDDEVDFTIGPLSGNEGIAVRDYAKLRPERTFLNGVAAAQDMTLRDPAPNFFNFMTNGVQWMAGAGTYVHDVLGYKKVVAIAENYSYPHSQIGGFMLEFCRAGGRVIEKFWVHLGKMSYNEIIDAIPSGIDAIFVALGGSDAVEFYQQYYEHTHDPLPIFAGSIAVDQSVLGTGLSEAKYLIGTLAAGPVADDNPAPAWQRYVAAYHELFRDGLPSPSLHGLGYYINTKAALLALEQVNGSLSDGQARFQNALSRLEFETPTGLVRLDHNRQAIANTFITIVVQDDERGLHTRIVKEIPDVNQTLGIPEDEYLQMKPFSADYPTCP